LRFLHAALIQLVVAAPALAQSRVVFVYPLALGDGVGNQAGSDAEGLILTALVRARNGMTLGSSQALEPSCGPARSAAMGCLAKLAGHGAILRGALSLAAGKYRLAVSMIDGQKEVGPVAVGLDGAFLKTEPVLAALQALQDRLTNPAPPPVAKRPTAPATAAPTAAAPAAPVPSTTPAPAASTPVAQARPPAPRQAVAGEPPVSALERAGKWTAAGGLVLLAGGAVVGLLDKHLNDQLTQRYYQHLLTGADLSSYHRVHTYNLLADSLFIAGGAAAVTGLGMWMAASDDEVQLGYGRRF
jgi:hypothetical protein